MFVTSRIVRLFPGDITIYCYKQRRYSLAYSFFCLPSWFMRRFRTFVVFLGSRLLSIIVVELFIKILLLIFNRSKFDFQRSSRFKTRFYKNYIKDLASCISHPMPTSFLRARRQNTLQKFF